MTQEEKDLLLKDLTARLPYGVKCAVFEDTSIHRLSGVVHYELYFEELDWKEYDGFAGIQYCKPYLRPMSSMTEEEKEEYDCLCSCCLEQDTVDYNISTLDRTQFIYVIDWLNEHHFDYRGLIPMGLALEAPEGMY